MSCPVRFSTRLKRQILQPRLVANLENHSIQDRNNILSSTLNAKKLFFDIESNVSPVSLLELNCWIKCDSRFFLYYKHFFIVSWPYQTTLSLANFYFGPVSPWNFASRSRMFYYTFGIVTDKMTLIVFECLLEWIYLCL